MCNPPTAKLQNLVKLLGENTSTSTIEKLIKEEDRNGDGRISFEEFLIMFRDDHYKRRSETQPES